MVSTKLRVKELLRERRWTTKVLAEKTGMSESYLTHIKNGTRRWNEDALSKLAQAFEIHPTDLFYFQKESADIESRVALPDISQLTELSEKVDLKVQVVPVLDQIPSNPTAANNRILQVAAGFKDKYVPVVGSDDDSMFCFHVEDVSLAPKFLKDDYLIISPAVWTRSGDIVAIEYTQNEEKVRSIRQINYMDDFVVLESVNHKEAPIALVRGKDEFRVIGKVISRYQKIG
ncbi:MAG: XRE family transcriptional regulator [Candidatus Babeliales bacterium]